METFGKILLWIFLIPIIILALRAVLLSIITALVGIGAALSPDSDERTYGVVAFIIAVIIGICGIALLMAIF